MAYLGKWAELHLLDDHHKGHRRRNKKGCISKSYYLFAEIVEHRVDIFFSKTWCPLRHHQYGSSLHWHEARIINFYIFSIRLRAYMLSRLVLNVGSIALKEKENSLPNTQKKKIIQWWFPHPHYFLVVSVSLYNINYRFSKVHKVYLLFSSSSTLGFLLLRPYATVLVVIGLPWIWTLRNQAREQDTRWEEGKVLEQASWRDSPGTSSWTYSQGCL